MEHPARMEHPHGYLIGIIQNKFFLKSLQCVFQYFKNQQVYRKIMSGKNFLWCCRYSIRNICCVVQQLTRVG